MDSEGSKGVEGSLARDFLGLSLVGLRCEILSDQTMFGLNKRMVYIIPRDKDILRIIRIINCNCTFLSTRPLDWRWRRWRCNFNAVMQTYWKICSWKQSKRNLQIVLLSFYNHRGGTILSDKGNKRTILSNLLGVPFSLAAIRKRFPLVLGNAKVFNNVIVVNPMESNKWKSMMSTNKKIHKTTYWSSEATAMNCSPSELTIVSGLIAFLRRLRLAIERQKKSGLE